MNRLQGTGCEARSILIAAAERLAAGDAVSKHNPNTRIPNADEAKLDARLLLAELLGRDDAVLPHETIAEWHPGLAARYEQLLERRLQGEPVSRIRGWREFWSLRFDLSPDTLDPRPDSETIVEAALAWAKTRPSGLRLVDLGTGSGCLLLACLSELEDAVGRGIDISNDAIKVAERNALALGLASRSRFFQGDFAAVNFLPSDLILSNPPYIPTGEIASLAPEVAKFDPMRALDGGDDGLECWRIVIPVIAAGLTVKGRAFVEIGEGQADAVTGIAAAHGLKPYGQHADFSGIVRCLVFGRQV